MCICHGDGTERQGMTVLEVEKSLKKEEDFLGITSITNFYLLSKFWNIV